MRAEGFQPNCDPDQKPAFDVHHPRLIEVKDQRKAPRRD